MSLPLALALYSVITVRTCWLLVFQPQLYNHLPSSRDHNRSFSRSSTYTRRTRLRMQQRKPNNSGCYWHQSLNTYLVRFGCPLLTKLVGYLTGGPIRLELLPYLGDFYRMENQRTRPKTGCSISASVAGRHWSLLSILVNPPPPSPFFFNSHTPPQKVPTSINPSPPTFSATSTFCSH
jgi:hypothetical protein